MTDGKIVFGVFLKHYGKKGILPVHFCSVEVGKNGWWLNGKEVAPRAQPWGHRPWRQAQVGMFNNHQWWSPATRCWRQSRYQNSVLVRPARTFSKTIVRNCCRNPRFSYTHSWLPPPPPPMTSYPSKPRNMIISVTNCRQTQMTTGFSTVSSTGDEICIFLKYPNTCTQ